MSRPPDFAQSAGRRSDSRHQHPSVGYRSPRLGRRSSGRRPQRRAPTRNRRRGCPLSAVAPRFLASATAFAAAISEGAAGRCSARLHARGRAGTGTTGGFGASGWWMTTVFGMWWWPVAGGGWPTPRPRGKTGPLTKLAALVWCCWRCCSSSRAGSCRGGAPRLPGVTARARGGGLTAHGATLAAPAPSRRRAGARCPSHRRHRTFRTTASRETVSGWRVAPGGHPVPAVEGPGGRVSPRHRARLPRRGRRGAVHLRNRPAGCGTLTTGFAPASGPGLRRLRALSARALAGSRTTAPRRLRRPEAARRTAGPRPPLTPAPGGQGGMRTRMVPSAPASRTHQSCRRGAGGSWAGSGPAPELSAMSDPTRRTSPSDHPARRGSTPASSVRRAWNTASSFIPACLPVAEGGIQLGEISRTHR